MLGVLPKVSGWANSKHYPERSIAQFFGCADFFIVAFALANGFTVVTNEANQPLSHTIKIPSACSDLGIPCMTTFDWLRAEKVSFVLATI
jgi:hypothetical protein